MVFAFWKKEIWKGSFQVWGRAKGEERKIPNIKIKWNVNFIFDRDDVGLRIVLGLWSSSAAAVSESEYTLVGILVAISGSLEAASFGLSEVSSFGSSVSASLLAAVSFGSSVVMGIFLLMKMLLMANL